MGNRETPSLIRLNAQQYGLLKSYPQIYRYLSLTGESEIQCKSTEDIKGFMSEIELLLVKDGINEKGELNSKGEIFDELIGLVYDIIENNE